MTDKPLLPRGVLTGEKVKARAGVRFPIDWQAVQEAAGVSVELSETDRANVESAALRYMLDRARERTGDGISFGKLRGQAGKISKAAEKLRSLLADPASPSLASADLDALQRLQDEAAKIANSDTGGRGSPVYSFDLRESLLRVLAGPWREIGGEVRCAAFYRAGAEVIKQANPDNMTDANSREKAVARFIEGWEKD